MKAVALAATSILIAANPAEAQRVGNSPADTASGGSVVLAPGAAANEINPTGQPVVLTVPLLETTQLLGDVTVTLDPDGRASLSAARVLSLIAGRVRPEVLTRLRDLLSTTGVIDNAGLDAAGIALRYNPQSLEMEMSIATASRGTTAVTLASDQSRSGITYVAPAELSAYLNVRGSLDWVQQGEGVGFTAPTFYLDGATRFSNVVLETEANWQPGGAGPSFQRRGTRLTYDDRANVTRWSAGDLLTLGRGFQSAPEIAGLSISRLYSLLDPQMIIRPRGNRSFRLDRRSMVEVRVNDQFVRRLELDPGSYDLKDFPFTQGSNDVQLTVTDDAGRIETLNFDIFLDQAQLADGLSEFGLYAGVLTTPGRAGPLYSDVPAATGFYRRGINDQLTLGVNAQGDRFGWMAGAETVIATPIGSLAAFGSASRIKNFGSGWAGVLNFQRTISRSSGRSDALSFSLEARSRQFAPVGTRRPFNPYDLIVGASYTSALSDSIYAGADARYSRGRDGEPDVRSLRGTMGWRINPLLTFTGDASYEQDARGSRAAVFLSLSYRLSARSNLRTDYDSRFNRARLAYQSYGGSGTGAYNVNAELERSDIGAGALVNAVYYGNRAELGLSHYGTFDRDFGGSLGQRTSLRFGTAIAAADGAFTIGRPVQDAFAIVDPHPSLRGARVLVDPSGTSAVATTGALGTAMQPSIGSYSERTIFVSSPDAPLDTELGSGSFRLMPPYRAGYRLRVGSDYNLSVVGRLVLSNGDPIRLVSGTASEVAHPEREPVLLFTNGDGRFGATGLAPGQWQIIMNNTEKTAFTMRIPEKSEGTLVLGDLSPTPQE
ncbi:fimbrial biogenesis outer membrane usher protein [Sphingomonas sp.]|jgi:outer membrane usher protein|uniref:fimbrial biogenesis outer membrane usher protein n=1 Tax=Sphingomonas sp. TaxID=28214 RepID=UPI002607CB0D|nr:fimbrial biogenesis outer membrane usher protein [Sphingomonas sp.]MDF2604647.1 pilus assembly protein PapC [Sphingomonas sp.]